jgi:hypothetical protein
MPNERRSYENFVTGTTTDNPLAAAATTINSAQLAALSDISASEHAVIVLDPFAEGTGPELAWITAHGAGATTRRSSGAGRARRDVARPRYQVGHLAGGVGLDAQGRDRGPAQQWRAPLPGADGLRPRHEPPGAVERHGCQLEREVGQVAGAILGSIIGGGWGVGNGSVAGEYRKHGRGIEINTRFAINTTTVMGAGGLRIGGFAPIGGVAASVIGIAQFGAVNFYDASTGTSYLGDCHINPGEDWVTVRYAQGALGTGPVVLLNPDSSHPANPMSAGDLIDLSIQYETTT